jgi:tetratricopeptide (TPR) repeat protein
MPRRINRKFLILLLLAVVLLGGGGFGLYTWQTRRHARSLLEQAIAAQEAGDAEQAIEKLRRYLDYRPKDLAALARYGNLLDSRKDSPQDRARALGVFERLLHEDPSREDVRRRLIHTALESGRHREAMPHLKLLLNKKADADLEEELGKCCEALGEPEQAIEWYAKAAEHQPSKIEVFLRQAAIHLDHQREDEARKAIDDMAAANTANVQALLARANFLRERGSRADQEKDIARAKELAPGDARVLLAEAELLRDKGELAQARERLRDCLKRHPKEFQAYRALSVLEMEEERFAEALVVLEDGLKAFPGNEEFSVMLAEAMLNTGRMERAGELLTALKKTTAGSARVEFLEARLLLQRGQAREAAEVLRKLRAAASSLPEQESRVSLLLALCHERLGQPDAQLVALRRAVNRRPNWAPARLALAAALLAAGQPEAAAGECALLQQPRPPAGTHLLRARALLASNLLLPAERRNWTEAERLLDEAEKAAPGSPEPLLVRIDVLIGSDRLPEARAILDKLRQQLPRSLEVRLAQAALAGRRGEATAALAALEEARRDLGDSAELRLALARLERQSKEPAAAERLALLEKGTDKWKAEERGLLLLGLAAVLVQRGNDAEARRLLPQAAEIMPDDPRPEVLLADLAVRASDPEALAKQLQRLTQKRDRGRVLEEYVEAVRSLLLAERGNKAALEQARKLQTGLANERPGWDRVLLLGAQLDELENKPQPAIEAYLRVLREGPFLPEVASRLIPLLYQQQRFLGACPSIRRHSRMPSVISADRGGRSAPWRSEPKPGEYHPELLCVQQ